MATEAQRSCDLCEMCGRIIKTAEKMFREGIGEADGEFNALTAWITNATVTKSCRLCVLLHHNRSADMLDFIQSGNTREIVLYKLTTTTISETAVIGICISAAEYILTKANVIFREGEIAKFKSFGDATTWSLATANQVMDWLKTCLVAHTHSCDTQNIRGASCIRLPARLLDTGIVNGGVTSIKGLEAISIEKMHDVCVCTSESLPKDTRYLTLSHRWSQSSVLVLNSNTLQAFQESIPYLLLLSPEAAIFRHAIEVTRSLGFRYLWIDALCINQDDEAEKASEIASMSEIYSNSMLNISASAASSGLDGLFFNRDPLLIEPYAQRAEEIAGDIIVYTDRFFEEVEQGLVNTRGWVFQERILSPRIIHFCRDQVFWECNSFRASAAFPLGCPSLFSVFGTRLKNWTPINSHNSLISHDTAKEVWAMLVSAYSSTSITYPQDRLLAISAVARRICLWRGLKEEDYIAGLWKPDLPWQLLWTVMPSLESSATILRTYRAPSWSWASVPMTEKDIVFWILKDCVKTIAEFVDVYVSWKTANIFGEITSGKITLRGPLCKIAAAVQHYPGESMSTHWDCLPHLARWQSLGPENMYLMPITLYQKPGTTTLDIIGLILQPIGEVQGYVVPGCYLRSGRFSISMEKGDWEDKYLHVFASKMIQSKDYVDFDGIDKYTIEII